MNKQKIHDNLIKLSAGGNNRAILNPILEAKTLVVSAFPGCGKSYLFNNDTDDIILDSDSSKFDKKDFPSNYIKHIKDNIDYADIILVSSHKDVRTALFDNEIKFILVYPDIKLKEEYLERYKQRGSPEAFIKLISTNWDSWVSDMNNQ